MTRQRAHRWWVAALAPVMFTLAASLSLGTGASVAAAAPHTACTGPVVGQHIYDCAHLLTPTEVSTLESDAAAVDRAGAPTVVYLQVRTATAEQTLQDAIDLMNRWNVESRPNAHDGFVMFFNLEPGNLRHGKVALYAGEKHYQHGNLPQSELDRIRQDVVTPLLQDGQTAAGIAAGLQMVAHDLIYGPPPPPRSQVISAFIGRIPFNILALLFGGLVALLYARVRRAPPLSTAGEGVSLDPVNPPSNLSPAMAGALIQGRVNDSQVESTVLDFAQRGLLVIEPVDKNKVQMRLLGDGNHLTEYERAVWKGLDAQASGDGRMLTSTDLAQIRKQWSWPKSLLRRDLIEKGWYDPASAARRRAPLYIAGALGLAVAAAAILLLVLSKEAWTAIGMIVFAAASITAVALGYSVTDTTVEGDIAAAPWRGYRDSVADRAYQPNMETDLPYIVALGLLGKLAPRLKAASEHGYSPSWFQSNAEGENGRTTTPVMFYPYWIAFHSSMAPASSGSASGGYSGGGAAGGGGGSAGSF
jgi:uncharacterized membrane protein YgcG